MKISLQDFRTSTLKQTTAPHRLASGFMPSYTDLASESSDSNFRDKVNPPYPLVLSPALTTLATKTSKRIVAMVEKSSPVITSSVSKVAYSTNEWDVFFDDPAEENFTTDPGSPSANDNVDIEIFQGSVITSFYSDGNLRFNAGATSTAWSSHTGDDTSTSSIKLFRKFRNGLMVSDVSYIRELTSGFVLAAAASSFRLVVSNVVMTIKDFNNFADQYMVVFFENTLSTSSIVYGQTDWVLWNGVDTNYEFKKTLRGKYRCSITRDNTIYAFTQLGTTVVCWQFTGNDFREFGRISNLIISTELPNPKMRVSLEKDFFVLMATSPGNISAESPFYWNPQTGENFFLAEQTTDALGLMITQQSDGAYQRYISSVSGSADSVLQKITLENSTRFSDGKYKSGIIPITDEKGNPARGKIKRVILEYNDAPASVSDRINFTFNTKDETEQETLTTNTAIIKDTTENSTNANVTDKRAIMDFNPYATEFDISLTTDFTTGSYWLIIRRIVIEYDLVIVKQ